jgi:glycerate kinase
MDEYLTSYADLTATATGRDLRLEAGAGAAGGLGFALLAYLGAELAPGVETVMRAIGLEEKMKDADIVVTGEGRMDGQSAMGKAPAGIAAAAKRHGASVIALCGARTEDIAPLHEIGIDAIFPILPSPMTLQEAMDIPTAYKNLKNTAEEAFRLYRAARGN